MSPSSPLNPRATCRLANQQVIIGILAMNATVGWYQEKQAGDIVAQLKAGIAMKATVVRDGQEKEIDAKELVPGDVLVLEEGCTIAADAKVSSLQNVG